MRSPWTRIVDAVAAALGRPRNTDTGLPPAALDEMARWTPEDVERYHRDGGGIAGADAPRIPDDGQI